MKLAGVMDDFGNNPELYALAVRMSHSIHRANNEFRDGEIILLATPTYIETGFSKCPITSLDGLDMVAEDRNSREIGHKLYDYNRARIFEQWKMKPFCKEDVRQVIAMTEQSEMELRTEGFVRVRSVFDFILYPAYEFKQ